VEAAVTNGVDRTYISNSPPHVTLATTASTVAHCRDPTCSANFPSPLPEILATPSLPSQRTPIFPSLIPYLSLTPSASQSFDFLSITIPHATSFPPNQEPHPKSNYAPPYFLTPLPIFHVLIKILNCYLHDILQQRLGEDEQKATVGIAISSFSDARIMYFCVHLSIGASLTISS
jgi:hypothetical protein